MIADINMKNKPCLIVGGGEQAYNKAVKLTAEGAFVTVISPVFSPVFDSLNVKKIYTIYDSKLLKGYFFVIAVTDKNDVNDKIISDCKEMGILSASVSGGGDVSFCSERNIGDIKISVSTGGKFPYLSKRLADRFCAETAEYEYNTELLQKCRQFAFKTIQDRDLCRKYFNELSECKRLDENKASELMKKYAKKAIIAVSFGNINTGDACLCKDLEKEFFGFEVRPSFTSQNIRQALKERKNIEILPPEFALQKLIKDGYRDILIAATNIIPGYEYHKLKTVAEKYNAKITEPFLSDNNIKTAAAAIKNISVLNAVNIWVGHGTSHDAGNAYKKLNDLIGDNNIIIGTVKGNMGIDYMLERLKNQGHKNIILRPLMYDIGSNAEMDICKGEHSLKTQLEENGYNVKCVMKGLSEEKEIRNIYLNEVRRTERDYERDNDKFK